MLSLDFADTAIIETIATAKTIMAIVPNSGTTCVPIISIFLSPFLIGILLNEILSFTVFYFLYNLFELEFQSLIFIH